MRTAWQETHLNDAERRALDDDARWYVHQSLSTPCLAPLEQCEGAELVDTQGRRYLDFHGNCVHQVGYRHPRVIDAVKRQLDSLPFCPRRFTNQPATELARVLARIAPGNLARVLLAPSGAVANGIALKAARYATGRHKTISFLDSFHGATLETISVGGEVQFRDGLGPLMVGSFHVPPPGGDSRADTETSVAAIAEILEREGDIGAILAEPMRATTVRQPSPGFWHHVRSLCDEHGTLLIFDEIPTGLGRTGKMFCCEHFDVVPDMLVLGKGLGGGVLPQAAVVIRDDLDLPAEHSLGHFTHEKSPLGAVAALATIDVIESEGLLSHAVELGSYTVDRLHALRPHHPLLGDIRGLGLAIGVDLMRGTEPACGEAEQVMYGCLSRGLSFKVSSGNVLTLTPPLILSRDQMDLALGILDEALAEVEGSGLPA